MVGTSPNVPLLVPAALVILVRFCTLAVLKDHIRDVGSSENLVWQVVICSTCRQPLLSDLPKSGGAYAPPALCVEIRFSADISWESRCNIEMSELTFVRFGSFWSMYLIDPKSKGCLKKVKSPKFGKGCLKLVSFYGSKMNGIVCVKQIGLGLVRTLKKY